MVLGTSIAWSRPPPPPTLTTIYCTFKRESASNIPPVQFAKCMEEWHSKHPPSAAAEEI